MATENTDSGVDVADERYQNELVAHREFLLRNVGMTIDVLAGEQIQQSWKVPAGCPDATPETLARRRGDGENHHPCTYTAVEDPNRSNQQERCPCHDPLCGSDDPLDAVAAALLADTDCSVDLYHDHSSRRAISALRDHFGTWGEIRKADPEELLHTLNTPAKGLSFTELDVELLTESLDIVVEHRYTPQGRISLTDLPSVKYEHLHGMLASLPRIGEEAAWWLLLTAFDKPVWPQNDLIEQLRGDLGLAFPETAGQARNTELEDVLPARRIPALHRALAGHVEHCNGDHADSSCEFTRFCLSHRLWEQSSQDTTQSYTVADLFCGAGGLSTGIVAETAPDRPNFEISLAVDNDQHATDTYRLNHPEVSHRDVHCEDIAAVANDTASFEIPVDGVDVVVGGPPCQALSVAGYRSRLADDESYSVLEDPRTELYKHYVSLLETLDPSYIIMENVEGIRSPLGEDGRRVIDEVQNALSRVGYEADHRLVDCSDLGIPQYRDRVILFGVSRSDIDMPADSVERFFDRLLDEPSGEVLIKQALSNIPRLKRGEGGDVVAGRTSGRPSDYVSENGLGDSRLVFNHRAREHLMEKDRKLFSEVMEPGDTGWDVKYNTEFGDLIEYDVGTRENPAFKDKYRMLHWDRPAPTIVAHLAKDGNSFILPDYYQYASPDESRQDDRRSRGITPREAARLQSFPDSYLFLGPFTSQFRQIGNAVPPLLGSSIARVIAEQLSDEQRLATPGSSHARADSDD